MESQALPQDHWLARTKLQRPRLREDIVPRQRLLDLFKTAADTDGKLLEMEATCQTSDDWVNEPYQPHQDEHFEILSGMISVRTNGQERTYVTGESFDIPRNTPHGFRNAASEEARVRWQVRPALKTEMFFETIWGLAGDGKTNDTGVPSLLQFAVLFQTYKGEFLLTQPPLIVQKILFGLLAPFSRLLGYRAHYEKYSGPTSGGKRSCPSRPRGKYDSDCHPGTRTT